VQIIPEPPAQTRSSALRARHLIIILD